MPQLHDHASRAHALLSASSSARWLACPPSAMIAERYPKVDTPFTREGTIAHEVAEVIASGGVLDAEKMDGLTPDMIRHAEEYRDYIQGLCNEYSEVLLEQRVDFSSWVPGGFGTADCIILSGNQMDVVDYKYGQGVAVSAESNPQMMLYGLGAMNDYGFIYSVDTVRLHIFQPRLGNVSVYECSALELLLFGEEVQQTAALAAKGEGKMQAGDHCRFCPHAGKCPKLALCAIGAVTVDDTIFPAIDTLSYEQIGAVLRLEPMISAWVKKLKEQALEALLAGKPIPGYKVVTGKAGNRKWSDELKVAETLRKAGYMEEDFSVVKLMSPAELDKSIGKKRVAEILTDLIDRAPGSPTVVPEADKRPAYDRVAEAKKDFE